MCGLAGIVSKDGSPIEPSEVTNLFNLIIDRGNQAHGIAMYKNGQWRVYKAVGSATNAENAKAVRRRVRHYKPTSVLLHTRFASHGSPKNLDNNHPIYHARKSFLLHNGVVYLPKQYNNAIGQTDTEQLLCHLEQHGYDGLEEVQGGFACFCVNLRTPKEIHYFRNNSNPLNVVSTDTALYFLSWPFTVDKSPSTPVPAHMLHAVLLNNDGTNPKVEIVRELPSYKRVEYPQTPWRIKRLEPGDSTISAIPTWPDDDDDADLEEENEGLVNDLAKMTDEEFEAWLESQSHLWESKKSINSSCAIDPDQWDKIVQESMNNV